MKAIRLITGVTTLAAASLWAIEGEPDDAIPPAAPGAVQPAAPAADAVEKAVAYMGVASTSMTPTLAEHLGLKAGEGVIVGAVLPDGPAAKAGLATHDVITGISGEPVGSPEELTHRVSSRNPGDTVKINLIRKGKATEIDLVLGTRPEPLAMGQRDALDQLRLDGVPEDLADRVRRMIEGNLGELKLELGEDLQAAAPQFGEALREIQERMEKLMQGEPVPADPPPGIQGLPLRKGGIKVHRGATFRMMDDQGSVEMKKNDDGKEVTVRDRDNNVVWSGPWDTDQDKAAAPDDIRRRIERLDVDDAGDGMRMKFRAKNPVE